MNETIISCRKCNGRIIFNGKIFICECGQTYDDKEVYHMIMKLNEVERTDKPLWVLPMNRYDNVIV